MEARRVDTSRGVFETYIFGSGPAVVMIPPLGRSGRDYADLAEALASNGYTSVAINPRGVAGSDPVQGLATLDDLSNDVVAIMDSLELERAHMLGQAMGNRVARRIAVMHPTRVESVTLLAAGGKVPIPDWASEALTRIYDPTVSAEQRLDDLAATCFSPSYSGSIENSGWLDGWWFDAANAQRAGGRTATTDTWWHAGKAPLLVIQGLDDVFAPPENGRSLAAEYPDRVTLVELEATGHAMLTEKPREVAEAVVAFLDSYSKSD